jgi:hypothetical protein
MPRFGDVSSPEAQNALVMVLTDGRYPLIYRDFGRNKEFTGQKFSAPGVL